MSRKPSLALLLLASACTPAVIEDKSYQFGEKTQIIQVHRGRFFTEATRNRAEEALKLMADVLQDPYFATLVKEGPKYKNDPKGYAKESRCSPGADVSGHALWEQITAAKEVSTTGQPLGGEEKVVDIEIRARVSSLFSIGATGGRVIHTNHRFIKHAALPVLVGHWLHEYMHMLGYCDGGVERKSPYLVSYWVGFAGCVVAATKLKDASPESRCIGSLGPGHVHTQVPQLQLAEATSTDAD